MDGGESPDTPQHSSKPFYTCLSFHFPFSIRESDSPLAIVLILLQSPTQSFLFSVPTQRFLFSSFATPFTILLFPISNPFSVSLSFHSHSSFQNPSSLHCISLILFQSLLHHSHIPFPFFLSKTNPHRNASLSHASLIHSPSLSLSIPILPFKTNPHRNASLSHALPIHSPSFTHSFPHVFPSSSLNRHSLSPTHNLPQESATMRVRGLHTYIE